MTDPFLEAFVPQLLATIVGGVIGVFAVWLAFGWQRRASAQDGVDQAVEYLLRRIAEYVSDLDAYKRDIGLVNWSAGQRPQRYVPHAAGVSIAVELLRMRTKGKERKVADEVGKAWSLAAAATLDKRGTACGFLAGAISDWRLGASPSEIADGLETVRQLALKDDESEIGTVEN
ncbi:hypothetical protein [Agromyces subbeticus]|uniref:hypothetical protein n=1 Tax=Agromyces subbeticus TaxID=293890 RepID=UPI0003B4B456|nr:hypothetical protein [Agromyces subbeticus]